MCDGHAGTCSDVETFDLDQQDIERKYKKLQTVYHPDRFANASEVTKASSPVSCAQYMLGDSQLHGTYPRGRRYCMDMDRPCGIE